MYYVYILKSDVNGMVYVGQTNDLTKRIDFHNSNRARWTKRYQPWKMIFKEVYATRSEAMKREKQLKNWHRQWKINLIESMNKDWKDLYSGIEDPLKKIFL